MKTGLLGRHLSHSYSKIIHESLMDYKYDLIEKEPEEIDQFFKGCDFDAINVTIPYKQTVIPYLHQLDESAEAVGAVNTIVNRKGTLIGYNTDVVGFKAILEYNQIEITDKKVIVLGNGGAAKAVLAVLHSLKPRQIVIVKKNASAETIQYEECYEKHLDAEVIINTSYVGMFPNDSESPIELDYFDQLESVVDIIYNPLKTKLIVDAIEKGCKVGSGLIMLVAQAVAAIEIFKDIKLDDSIMINKYKEIEFQKTNFVFIGMPGCGKTTIANLYAKQTGRTWIDMDHTILEKIEMPIADFFSAHGEKEFRDIEHQVCIECSSQTGLVISTGGGVVKRNDNMQALKRNGCCMFIDREVDKLALQDGRPLSKSLDDVKKIYEDRIGLYQKYADITIHNNSTLDDVLKELNEKIERWNKK